VNPIPSFKKVAMGAAVSRDMQAVGNPSFPNPRGANPAITVAPPVHQTRNVMIEDPSVHGNGSIPTRYLSN
jgi:hypothetical protein